MKNLKFIIFILILFVFSQLKTYADGTITNFQKIGETYLINNIPYQQYRMDIINCTDFDLYLTNKDQSIKNQQDSSITYHNNSLKVTTSSNKKSLPYNIQKVIIDDSVGIGNISVFLTFTIEPYNYNWIASGNYSIRIIASTEQIGGMQNYYNVDFNVPKHSNITVYPNRALITLSKNQVFSKNNYIENKTNSKLNIISNSKWDLYLNTNNLNIPAGEHYIEVIGSQGDNIEYTSGKIKLKSNTEYFLGKKTAISNNNNSSLDIKYTFLTPSDSYAESGNYINQMNFDLK